MMSAPTRIDERIERAWWISARFDACRGTRRGRRTTVINALRYEPQGQRQRFEPREQQSGEREKQDRHIHLNLTFRSSQGRSTSPNAMRIARICAALLAATVMPLVAFLFAFSIHDGLPDPLISLGNLPFVLLFAGLVLAWGCGGFPLLVSAF
jgi:hypothetical protein